MTKKNNHARGLAFIESMCKGEKCIPFINSRNPRACNCLDNFAMPMEAAKSFFCDLIGEYWSTPRNTAELDASELSEMEGFHLANFLRDYCTFLSARDPKYEFVITSGICCATTITICLPTLVRIFGLPTATFLIVSRDHRHDRKRIGVSVLKYMCCKFVSRKKSSAVYQQKRLLFGQEVIPVVSSNPHAVAIVENMWDGKIVTLSAAARSSLSYLLWNCSPSNLPVGNGGQSIKLGLPSSIEPWDGLDKKEETKALHDLLCSSVSALWSPAKKKLRTLSYRVVCLFSQVSSDNPDGFPQNMHTDFSEKICNETQKALGVYPLVGFVPMHPDGCMLLIWSQRNIDRPKTGPFNPQKYFLYIPYGVCVILRGDAPHAGGFCFGRSGNTLGFPANIADYTNHRLHFFFCPNWNTKKQALGIKMKETRKTAPVALATPRQEDIPGYEICAEDLFFLNKGLLNQVCR